MILIVDDDPAIRTSMSLLLRQEGFAVQGTSSPQETLNFISRQTPELIILDLNFSIETSGAEGLQLLAGIKEIRPHVPVILITGWGSIELAVKGMKLGARDFITKPWQNSYVLQTIRTLLHLEETPRPSSTRQQLDQHYAFDSVVGNDAQLLALLDTVGRVAATDAPVLITGESGTGKELIAEAIHQNSKRKGRPFIKVNLGGISSTLFESELFGHVRGAFTDARTDRAGRFEMADRGSIFLDEIGELDLSSQVKLLRVLQERTFEPLGSSKSRTVDVRVVCATNRNLDEMVQQGTFREDLFYRINLITVKLPALRERAGDIPLLAEFFINNLKTIYQRPSLQLAPSAAAWLKTLPLPGNIRQLKNMVERTVLLSRHNVLEVADFQKNMHPEKPSFSRQTLPEVGSITLEEMEYQMIRRAMEFHQNKVTKVARSLGITRFALYRRLEKYGITYESED
ncbi:sigma-54-dependent transcriptional regulator [Arundinibacter roseus]|uniref:Sigma-54-dependent Fis family transcriptional regulator n=1 Tax=Arundinibacter roseus TaxID=2070510 RepID=A0A4R4KK66_9BACT|nr:sigma-54 dependent transcriptional regulator [Arundinibacter roseus]TDB67306.1 sigma-54-dependent Fis family transcriptional regulator [Arundinibacter roseus]